MWECYLDENYYKLWAVKLVGSTNPSEVFHIHGEDEAKKLCDLLNKSTVDSPEPSTLEIEDLLKKNKTFYLHGSGDSRITQIANEIKKLYKK